MAINEISLGIWNTSKGFDLDTNVDDSPLDRLVQEDVIQKALDNDNLIYVEGHRAEDQPEFITKKEFEEELEKKENWDTISAGDFQAEFDEMFEEIDRRQKPKLGFFEQKEYFDKIFPSLKIQKPGYDLYGTSTIDLSLMALFVFFCYDQITVDKNIFKFMAKQSAIFGGEMALVILTIITIIILERYTNRSDTKAETKKRLSNSKDMDVKQGYFNQEDMFKRN